MYCYEKRVAILQFSRRDQIFVVFFHQFVGQLGAEDIQRLRAMETGNGNYVNGVVGVNPSGGGGYVNGGVQPPQLSTQLSAIQRYGSSSHFYANNNSLVRTSNLELVRGPASMRASSPLNQVLITTNTTLQSLLNAKLSQQRLWHCQENWLERRFK